MKIIKIILRILVIILAITAIITMIRVHNDKKYKPKNYIGQNDENPNDLSSYNKHIKNVEVKHIKGEYLNGFRLKPKKKLHKGVIITFGGSEGSPGYWYAREYAKKGYEVLALFFFGMENQENELVKVPLDFFDEVLTYIEKHIKDGDIITIDGGSKGAELALNLATRYPQIDNLILRSPSAYSFSGLPKDNYNEVYSSWTWNGKEVPYINIQKSGMLAGSSLFKAFALNEPVSFRASYEAAVKNDTNLEDSRIKVENTKANILIIAGDDDAMWQSDTFAKEIQGKRPENTEVHIYKGVGHIFSRDKILYSKSMIVKLGGDKDNNKRADSESKKIIDEKLETWHK